jgi:hypothetical protein
MVIGTSSAATAIVWLTPASWRTAVIVAQDWPYLGSIDPKLIESGSFWMEEGFESREL